MAYLKNWLTLGCIFFTSYFAAQRKTLNKCQNEAFSSDIYYTVA